MHEGIAIDEVENAADDILHGVLAGMFATEKDPIMVIKRKDICETMELITDRCEDVANVLQPTCGIPLSTTHTIAGAIMGVGSTKRLSAVRRGVARCILWARVSTIPCSAIVAALADKASSQFW